MINQPPVNILILGASGMLGSSLFYKLPLMNSGYNVFGTYRKGSSTPVLGQFMTALRLDDVFNRPALVKLLKKNKINVIINAVGLIKQIKGQVSKSDFIKINAWLPHFIAEICEELNIRFIEISTDCVFSGTKGNYNENSPPDAQDIYGVTKLLGEITDKPNVLTIRTSIIGHENNRSASLVDWFLSSSGTVNGYRNAVFSGFPTVVLSSILGKYILPDTSIHGLFHISSRPINKFELLSLIADIYNHKIVIKAEESTIIDRSLNSDKFMGLTGYEPPEWPELIEIMKRERPKWNQHE